MAPGRLGERPLPRPSPGALLLGGADRARSARGLRGSEGGIRATSGAVVAAKSLLATAFRSPVALALSALAPAANPTVKIRSSDQAKAVAALLRPSDFGAGWQGGETRATPLQPLRTAPASTPRSPTWWSAATPTQASGSRREASYSTRTSRCSRRARPRSRRTSRARSRRGLGSAWPTRSSARPTSCSASVQRIAFPPTGASSAAYRGDGRRPSGVRPSTTVLSDYVFFGQGRIEYSFNVIAPLGARNQLGRFELALAEILLKRAAGAQA